MKVFRFHNKSQHTVGFSKVIVTQNNDISYDVNMMRIILIGHEKM